MEQQPSAPPQNTSLFEMDIDATGQNHLNTISKWGKFIGITVIILCGLVVIGLAVQYQEVVKSLGSVFSLDNNAAGILLAVLVIIGGLSIVALIYLLKGCSLIKQGLVSQNSDKIAEGFKSFKVVFTVGIIFSALSILSTIFAMIK